MKDLHIFSNEYNSTSNAVYTPVQSQNLVRSVSVSFSLKLVRYHQSIQILLSKFPKVFSFQGSFNKSSLQKYGGVSVPIITLKEIIAIIPKHFIAI